jgi:hypothetical protein
MPPRGAAAPSGRQTEIRERYQPLQLAEQSLDGSEMLGDRRLTQHHPHHSVRFVQQPLTYQRTGLNGMQLQPCVLFLLCVRTGCQDFSCRLFKFALQFVAKLSRRHIETPVLGATRRPYLTGNTIDDCFTAAQHGARVRYHKILSEVFSFFSGC